MASRRARTRTRSSGSHLQHGGVSHPRFYVPNFIAIQLFCYQHGKKKNQINALRETGITEAVGSWLMHRFGTKQQNDCSLRHQTMIKKAKPLDRDTPSSRENPSASESMIQGFKAYLCPRSLRVQPLHSGTLGRAEQSFPASHIYWLCHAHQTTCCSHMECNVLQSLWVWGGQNQPGAFPALLCIDCASIHHLYL